MYRLYAGGRIDCAMGRAQNLCREGADHLVLDKGVQSAEDVPGRLGHRPQEVRPHRVRALFHSHDRALGALPGNPSIKKRRFFTSINLCGATSSTFGPHRGVAGHFRTRAHSGWKENEVRTRIHVHTQTSSTCDLRSQAWMAAL